MEETEYANSLVEVKEVLDRLSTENYNKIPKEVIQAIEENKSKDYEWEYNDDLKLKDQNISEKAIIILSYINEEYLLNEEQKELMQRIYRENERKLQEEKKEKYKTEDLFKNKHTKIIENTEETALVVRKDDRWYSKFIKFIKNIFGKKD